VVQKKANGREKRNTRSKDQKKSLKEKSS
jgi:hypothetical protein